MGAHRPASSPKRSGGPVASPRGYACRDPDRPARVTPAATRRSRCATSRRASASARPTASRYATSVRCSRRRRVLAITARRPSAGSRAAGRPPRAPRPASPRCPPRAPRRRRSPSTTVAPQRARSGCTRPSSVVRHAADGDGRVPSRLRASRSCASNPAWMRAIRSRWPSAISPVSADQAARSSCVSPGAGAIAWPLSEPSTVQIASTSAIESDERAVATRRQRTGDGHLGVAVDDLGGAGDERDLEPGALLAGCPAHAHPAAREPAREGVRGLVAGVDLADQRVDGIRGERHLQVIDPGADGPIPRSGQVGRASRKNELGAGGDLIARGAAHGDHGRVVRRGHRVLHLHRLEHRQHGAGRDLVALGAGDGEHAARHGGGDAAATRRRGPRGGLGHVGRDVGPQTRRSRPSSQHVHGAVGGDGRGQAGRGHEADAEAPAPGLQRARGAGRGGRGRASRPARACAPAASCRAGRRAPRDRRPGPAAAAGWSAARARPSGRARPRAGRTPRSGRRRGRSPSRAGRRTSSAPRIRRGSRRRRGRRPAGRSAAACRPSAGSRGRDPPPPAAPRRRGPAAATRGSPAAARRRRCAAAGAPRLTPVTSSVTGCSTCRRAFTSRKYAVPSGSRSSSIVAAPA